MADHIRYDLLTQQALRGVVRNVLIDTAKKGLPGDHHFYISFDTHADGLRLSDRLRAQYPEEMTIILQHQFWDLAVNEQGFEVGMSFEMRQDAGSDFHGGGRIYCVPSAVGISHQLNAATCSIFFCFLSAVYFVCCIV